MDAKDIPEGSPYEIARYFAERMPEVLLKLAAPDEVKFDVFDDEAQKRIDSIIRSDIASQEALNGKQVPFRRKDAIERGMVLASGWSPIQPDITEVVRINQMAGHKPPAQLLPTMPGAGGL